MRKSNRLGGIAFTLGLMVVGTAVDTQAAHEEETGPELRTIPYEGYIDLDGQALNTTVQMNFALFSCEDPGGDTPGCDTPLWIAVADSLDDWTVSDPWSDGWPDSLTPIEVPISGGRFAIDMGNGGLGMNPLPGHLFLDHEALYLAIEVEGIALTGLQRIAPATSALRTYEALDFYIDGDMNAQGHVDVGGDLDVASTVMQRGAALVPPGTVVIFAGVAVPDGWIECVGQELDKEVYPALFTALGTTYGETNGIGGVGTTHFRVPDLRGYFVRGLDERTTSSNDPFYGEVGSARSLGSSQGDAFQGHQHANESWAGYNGDGSANPRNQGYGSAGPYGNSIISRAIVTAGLGAPRYATETRPQNIALRYIIKY